MKDTTVSMSASVEDYLTAIYRLTPAGKPVGPSRLAEFMGLSGPSITLMVKRLTDQGLVLKNDGRGVALSEDGSHRALAVLRKHRLAERFLVDQLGLDWALAHVEAHRFEHALSDAVTDALERYLGKPDRCPHGQPIPDANGYVAPSTAIPLSTLAVGARGRVESVADDDAGLLRWLAEVGIVPGIELEVRQLDPSGALLLWVNGHSIAAGPSVVRHILVNHTEVTP
ncbi:MAG: metal-dependent transcriptional regulator [Proteobacteria bacterium]|nr:metal-dependent transcriptional regulator [Pseudomonadota bacterium]